MGVLLALARAAIHMHMAELHEDDVAKARKAVRNELIAQAPFLDWVGGTPNVCLSLTAAFTGRFGWRPFKVMLSGHGNERPCLICCWEPELEKSWYVELGEMPGVWEMGWQTLFRQHREWAPSNLACIEKHAWAPADVVRILREVIAEKLGEEKSAIMVMNWPVGQFDGDEEMPDAVPA